MRQNHQGFTLIAAIYLLVFVSIAMALMLSLTTQTVKQTSNIYLKEQAVQLSRSATEYALLAISGHDRMLTNDCVETIISHYPAINPIFDITTSIRYFGLGSIAGCQNLNNIQTSESNGTAIVDVYVSLSNTSPSQTPIRYHRRTLQKP